MSRSITITVADYQRIERRLIDELAAERRLTTCLERRTLELEQEVQRLQERLAAPVERGDGDDG